MPAVDLLPFTSFRVPHTNSTVLQFASEKLSFLQPMNCSELCSFWHRYSHFLSPPALCRWKPCREDSKVNRAERKMFRAAFHWGNQGLVLKAVSLARPHFSSICPHHTQEGFQPFQSKPGVIAERAFGFLWILAQNRLLSTPQEKYSDSPIYAPSFFGWAL